MATKRSTSLQTDTKPAPKAKAPKQELLFPSIDCPPSAPIKTGRKKQLSRITIRHDAGFGNILFLRGSGNELSWEKGIPLINISQDSWTWESTAPFHELEFKVLMNDIDFEIGENHRLICGGTIEITPQF